MTKKTDCFLTILRASKISETDMLVGISDTVLEAWADSIKTSSRLESHDTGFAF